jgi:hypothetical protein
MKEQNRLRLERLTARYARRVAEGRTPDEADFLRSFAALRDDLLRPEMEEVAAELRRAGHEARILLDQGHDTPSIELALGLRGATGSRNVVGFCVIRWKGHPLQILAYLEVNPPPFDLERFADAAAIGAERVEQLLVDAVEHIIMCNAP